MITYSYTYKLQGDGLDSWTRTQTEDGEVIFVDMVWFLTAVNWTLKAVLNEDGLLVATEAAINALPEPTKTNALFAWNNSDTINSNSDTVVYLQDQLGLTLEQVIDIFARAQNFSI